MQEELCCSLQTIRSCLKGLELLTGGQGRGGEGGGDYLCIVLLALPPTPNFLVPQKGANPSGLQAAGLLHGHPLHPCPTSFSFSQFSLIFQGGR